MILEKFWTKYNDRDWVKIKRKQSFKIWNPSRRRPAYLAVGQHISPPASFVRKHIFLVVLFQNCSQKPRSIYTIWWRKRGTEKRVDLSYFWRRKGNFGEKGWRSLKDHHHCCYQVFIFKSFSSLLLSFYFLHFIQIACSWIQLRICLFLFSLWNNSFLLRLWCSWIKKIWFLVLSLYDFIVFKLSIYFHA